jgi:zinc transport system substrate-binding protein
MPHASILSLVLCPLLAAVPATDAAPLPVVVSLPPQIWVVESVGGARVSVAALVGPGDSEETYSPTDVQVTAALRAKVLFRIGASFEEAPWFDALTSAGGLPVVDAGQGVDRVALGRSGLDPHIWTSPRRLAIQARNVAATLGRLDPSNREFYDRALTAVTRELEILDRELAQKLAPYRGRAFFVFHPTWGYLASDYGLRQIAVEVDGKEPTDLDLTRIQELARVEHPRSLFVERQVSGRAAGAVAAALGASVVPLDPLAADVPSNLRRVVERLVEGFAK